MKTTTILLALLLILPLTTAITITAPTEDITTTTLPTTITTSWTGTSNNTYHVLLQNTTTTIDNTTTNNTSKNYELGTGTYTLTVTQDNDTDTTTFNVAQTTPLTITLTIQENSVETGETIHLQATASTQTSATLTIQNNGETIETYTLNIQDTINLIYIPETPGRYTATLTAGSATATDTITVTTPEPLTIDYTHSTSVVNKQTNFTATANGGTPPYTYQWIFSDDTTSQGQTTTHYFFNTGTHTTTLVVTDSEGTQKSVEKTINVQTGTYKLEVTIQDEEGTILQDIDVILTQNGEATTKRTTDTGTVKFEGLQGTYTLAITRLSTTYDTRTVEMDQSRNLLITIDFGTETTNEETTNKTTNNTNTTNNTTNTTNTTQETLTAPTPAPEAQALKTPTTTKTPTIEDIRQEHITTIRERKFDLQLNQKKDAILRQLELYTRFDQAITQLETASEAQIPGIMNNVPTDVTINEEQTMITYPEGEELATATNAFLEAKGISDEDLQEQYRYNIEETALNTSVKTTRTTAIIHYPNKKTAHTIIHKDISTSTDTTIIEVIPKTFAKDVSKLRVDGNHEVIQSDPILRFKTTKYTYSTAQETTEYGYSIALPNTLQETSLITGLITFKFGTGNPTRSIIYIVLLAIFLVGLTAGSKITKKKAAANAFNDFTELTEQALTLIQTGQTETAANITPDITAIYETLPEEQQLMLKDVMEHLQQNEEQVGFIHTLDHVYELVSTAGGDVNILSPAYEAVITTYEQFPEHIQEQLKPHLTKLEAYLDGYIT